MSEGIKLALGELATRANAIAVTEASPAEDVALMHSELSEMLEDIRDHKNLEALTYERKVELPPNIFDMVTNVLANIGLVAPAKARFITVVTTEKSHIGPDGKEVLHKPVGVPSELADVLIRAFHFAGKHRVPLARAILEKMAYNESRAFKHGGRAL